MNWKIRIIDDDGAVTEIPFTGTLDELVEELRKVELHERVIAIVRQLH